LDATPLPADAHGSDLLRRSTVLVREGAHAHVGRDRDGVANLLAGFFFPTASSRNRAPAGDELAASPVVVQCNSGGDVRKIVVIGAGSAGCVVASKLSDDPNNDVLVLEAGQDRTAETRAANLRSISYLDAADEQQAFWPNFLASFRTGEAARLYLHGKGVGGSGSVNALIALPGLTSDYDRWRDNLGCIGWGWDDVAPTFESLLPTLRQVKPDELTPVDAALIHAAADQHLNVDLDLRRDMNEGAGRLWLTADGLGRRSSAEIFLDGVRPRTNLQVRGITAVHSVVLNNKQATGVRLNDGSVISADEIILCAGAFGSPEILLRSGVTRPGVGKNLRDHAAIRVDLTLSDRDSQEKRSAPTIGSVVRSSSGRSPGDVHLLPIHGKLPDSPTGTAGSIVMALMTVRSTGEVRLQPGNPDAAPIINMNLLHDAEDQEAFFNGLGVLHDTLDTPAFTSATTNIVVGHDAPIAALRSRSFVDSWLPGRLGQYVHPVGTCRMGSRDDDLAVVDPSGKLIGFEGVSVIDASVMPDIPAANTHLPTVMMAIRLTEAVCERLRTEDASVTL